jgi:hypothetical protein
VSAVVLNSENNEALPDRNSTEVPENQVRRGIPFNLLDSNLLDSHPQYLSIARHDVLKSTNLRLSMLDVRVIAKISAEDQKKT